MVERLCTEILGTGHGHTLRKLRVLQESGDWELARVSEPDPEPRGRERE
jgi:hypothetical protein